MVHQYNPEMRPDSDFVPGALAHLVLGNRGRCLDNRRTPFILVGVDVETGYFAVRIEGFEDKGAVWEEVFERIDGFQFEKGSREASPEEVAGYESAICRLDKRLTVPCDLATTRATAGKLDRLEEEAGEWLSESSGFFARERPLITGSREGHPELWNDLKAFLAGHDLGDMEDGFAAQFVSNPYSGEMIKGHRIVMAELGLVPYEGKIVRGPDVFEDRWSRKRRAAHILRRLAFLRAVFARAGVDRVTLYRGICFEGQPEPPRNKTFVSTSFRFDVARSCYGPRETLQSGLLMRQAVLVSRVFMTYLETAEMNRQFKEAEAILLYDGENALF